MDEEAIFYWIDGDGKMRASKAAEKADKLASYAALEVECSKSHERALTTLFFFKNRIEAFEEMIRESRSSKHTYEIREEIIEETAVFKQLCAKHNITVEDLAAQEPKPWSWEHEE